MTVTTALVRLIELLAADDVSGVFLVFIKPCI